MASRRAVVVSLAGAGLVAAAATYAVLLSTGVVVREVCAQRLDRPVLEASLTAGTHFLVSQQRPEGNFVYEYDWVARRDLGGDHQVRQAGAVWGLALLYQAHPQPEVQQALERALAFFARTSRTLPSGAIVPGYKEESRGELGTAALLNLAYIEYLRAPRGQVTEEQWAAHRRQLDGLMVFLLSLQRPDGLFASFYGAADGVPAGDPNPYGDGESMLAMAKMARYLGREDLKQPLAKALEAGYRKHVVQARQKDRDSDETKGFYQWSTMAFWEASTGWPEFAVYGDHALELADWMVDTHHVLSRQRNTAYAYEGLLHALDLARRKGDAAHAERLACVSGQGLEALTGWQVGGPLPNRYIVNQGAAEPRTVGGLQNERDAPALRIDVTQHQMHAVQLALEWLYPPAR